MIKPTHDANSCDPREDSDALAILSGAKEAPKQPRPRVSSGNLFQDIIEEYRDRPVEFVVDLLKQDPLPWQRELLTKLAEGKRRLTIRAGHGVGKSTACSWAIIWHFFTRYPQETLLTAPTAPQLFGALYKEVKRQIENLPPVLQNVLSIKADRIEYAPNPAQSSCSARTASRESPQSLAGVHSQNVLIICDEASDIPESNFEALSGSMSSASAITILIGNPVKNTGYFYTTHQSATWEKMHVSCVDIPIVTPEYIEEQAETYGPESNQFRVRVLGEWPTADDDTLIPASDVDGAMSVWRDITVNPDDDLVYGVDPARYGSDRATLCKRRGNVVLDIKSWRNLPLTALAGHIAHEARQDNPAMIAVDAIGVGAGVADILREQGFNVRDVNVSESVAMNPSCFKLRDELWVAARDWLRTKICKLPNIAGLREELCAPTYTFNSSGKLVVESKENLKKRGVIGRKSPDLADALCLTFAVQAAYAGGRASKWVKGKPLLRRIKSIV